MRDREQRRGGYGLRSKIALRSLRVRGVRETGFRLQAQGTRYSYIQGGEREREAWLVLSALVN